MKSQPRTRVRLAMFVAGAAIAIAGAVVGGGVASAHHPEITASASCDNIVRWTVYAWDGPTEDSRTNPDVVVTYSVDLGAPTTLATGAFNPEDSFQFSGQFGWPAGATQVDITVTAVGPWKNGSGGGSASTVKVQLKCSTTTTVPVTTTTVPVTTTTEVGSGGPVTTTTNLVTTTMVGSAGPTTTLASNLPRTGQSSGSLGLVALGLLLMGASFVLAARRPTA